MHSLRNGHYQPLIAYLVLVSYCLVLFFDVGRLRSRISERMRAKRGNRWNPPEWYVRYGALLAIAVVTVFFFVVM
jgi:hypothetical protein